jgi:hypothetical protein
VIPGVDSLLEPENGTALNGSQPAA